MASFSDRRALLIARAALTADPARALSDLTDTAVAAMAEAALSGLTRRWCLIALGGWGAGRLLPGSDLDLLVVTDASVEELRPAAAALLYPMWDAGLTVGHQVRTPAQHARACRSDLETLTASLVGRPIAGDLELGSRTLADVTSEARRHARRWLRRIGERPRPGSPYLLEPDLKNGAGGQRDLDELVWTSALLARDGSADLRGLAGCGVFDVREIGRLERAAETITAARWLVQREAGRPTNRLDLDLAERSPDARGLQVSLADVHHLLLRARARLAGRPLDGDVTHAAPLGVDDLSALLTRGAEAVPALEDAAWSGRLDDLLPGMSDLMMLGRPGLTHVRTVGSHSLRCAALLGGSLEMQRPRGGGRRGPARLSPLQRAQLFAALVHDFGKVHPGPGHADRGADIARTLAPRFGLDAPSTDSAITLVREHLLLPETVTTEDIHDEDVILRAAARLRDPELVAPLLALTRADAEATGPETWGPWLAALAGELADRIASTLAEDSEGAGLAARAESVRRAVQRRARALGDRDVLAFAEHAPLRYLAGHGSEQVMGHARLVATVDASEDPARAGVAVDPGPVEHTWRVTVVAGDRPGLLTTLTGAITLSGLDILSAEVFTIRDGTALDSFVVRSDTLAIPGPSLWTGLERTVADALAGHIGLDAALARRRVHYDSPRRRHATVWMDTPGAYATALHVTATDRMGLLHDVAGAIADEGFEVRWMRATTVAGVARDVFHIVDRDGEPVTGHGELGHLAMRVRALA